MPGAVAPGRARGGRGPTRPPPAGASPRGSPQPRPHWGATARRRCPRLGHAAGRPLAPCSGAGPKPAARRPPPVLLSSGRWQARTSTAQRTARVCPPPSPFAPLPPKPQTAVPGLAQDGREPARPSCASSASDGGKPPAGASPRCLPRPRAHRGATAECRRARGARGAERPQAPCSGSDPKPSAHPPPPPPRLLASRRCCTGTSATRRTARVAPPPPPPRPRAAVPPPPKPLTAAPGRAQGGREPAGPSCASSASFCGRPPVGASPRCPPRPQAHPGATSRCRRARGARGAERPRAPCSGQGPRPQGRPSRCCAARCSADARAPPASPHKPRSVGRGGAHDRRGSAAPS
mmetsp:Transcript_3025/g.8391  ORF Transcript_3025/g.8391 Transcript_3025/m.8391 type:complete len:349 (+) Transcript_3025:229-1275(+)